jgi:hypothetical protein
VGIRLNEPFDTTFRGVGRLIASGAEGSVGKGCTVGEYADFCRTRRNDVVALLDEIVGQAADGLTVELVGNVPRHLDGADLYLEVKRKDSASHQVMRYVVLCSDGASDEVRVERTE